MGNQLRASALIVMLLGNSWASAGGMKQPVVGDVIHAIEWVDGDSGMIGEFEFRLKDMDARELSPVGRKNGAKCLAERSLGRPAKNYMSVLSSMGTLRVSRTHGVDKYERLLIDITVDKVDIGLLGVQSGFLQPWPHEGHRPLAPRPQWCAE